MAHIENWAPKSQRPGGLLTAIASACLALAATSAAATGCGGTDSGGTNRSADTSSSSADAGSPDSSDASSPSVCGIGTWVLNESSGPCGSCGGISDFVVLTITSDLAANGGTTSDSEGNTWQFQPATCSATLTGDCNASDVINFANGTATCQWTCGGYCPICTAECDFEPF